ncbi:MAG: HlyC/CorC family transporter [Gemmatimonadota bacterium]|nr:MAG: HlyC/CorC family transporter [Gemmatimonadota bacterium]
MNTFIIFEFAVFLLLLAFSAFFSGSEMAFFSLSKATLRRMREEKLHGSELISSLLSRPKRLLVTILIGNTLVNVAAASLAAFIAIDLANQHGWNEVIALVIEVFGVTALILVFGEVTPKVYAVKYPEKFSQFVAGPIRIVSIIFFPLTSVLTSLTKTVTELRGKQVSSVSVTEEELKTMVEVGREEGALDKDEQEMIHSIFAFGETAVREVMIPRIDMICVEIETERDEVLQLISSAGHTRIPVFQENVDNILGILHAKDLLKGMSRSPENIDLLTTARKPYFVPETKKIDDLLREFQRKKIHMAIVVDEYGGTSGLVTLEDLLEEIVGEIHDEFDVEEPLFSRIDENTIEADARINIHDLNELLEVELPSDGFETLGGFIFNQMGKVPQVEDRIEYDDLTFIIKEVSRQRISKVRIQRKSQSQRKSDTGPDTKEYLPPT